MDILKALSEGASTGKELESKGVSFEEIEDARREKMIIAKTGKAIEEEYGLRCLPPNFKGNTFLYAINQNQYTEWIKKNRLVKGASIRNNY